MTEISVVVPVYKGQDSLSELYRRLKESLETFTWEFEIILVEDCGGDASWIMIQALAKQDQRVRGFQFSRNFGQHCGITAGLDKSTGNWVVVMDGDLQDRPEEIPRLYAKAQEGFEVVVARRGRRKDTWFKRAASRAFYQVFSSLAGIRMDAEVGNFRIISRKVADCFCRMRETTRFFGGMVEWMGFPSASIDVQHDPRFEGQSTYTFRKLFNLAVNIIIAYSDKPLWISIRLGFLISLLSVLGGGFVVFRAIRYGIPIMGWASLIVSLYFLGGVIISLLGVIGIYLAKVFDGIKNRPLYVVAQQTD
jgi:polyisoprenyl-phosphate glycosyltransferase